VHTLRHCHSHATDGAFGFSRRELHSDLVWCSTPQQDAHRVRITTCDFID
jgi:hypothetical protein